jgi:hypothetical protein
MEQLLELGCLCFPTLYLFTDGLKCRIFDTDAFCTLRLGNSDIIMLMCRIVQSDGQVAQKGVRNAYY